MTPTRRPTGGSSKNRPRQGSRTWLTLDGSIRSTAVLTEQQLSELTSKPRTSADPAPH